ncbi:MAG TPA: hypothetical protein PLX21_05870 [Rhodocyclaceae bacterium]|nr:hypothetical protein [Rhodocyclaceae bacterium]
MTVHLAGDALPAGGVRGLGEGVGGDDRQAVRRTDAGQQLDLLAAHVRATAGEVLVPVGAQHTGKGGRRQAGPVAHPPAQQGRRVVQAGQGVTGVELAVAESPLAVLPHLPPHDAGQPHGQCRPGREGARMGGPQLEGVDIRQVVVEAVLQVGQAGHQHVGFDRMQVAAGRVGAHRPAVRPQALPRGDAEGQVQQRAEGRQIRRGRRRGRRGTGLGTGQGQADAARAAEMPEGRRLGVPIQCGGAAGVGVEAVTGAPVIGQHQVGGRDRRRGGLGGSGFKGRHDGQVGHGLRSTIF